MKIYNILKFFFVQVEKKNWIYVIFNYFLVLFITCSEIIFLGIFYLLLNEQFSSKIFNSFLENVKLLNNKFFLDFKENEFYIIILLFFLIIKTIITIFQSYFYGIFIHNITLNKSSSILCNYLNLDFKSFNKKELSTYIKQITRDVESAFLGIFGTIISLVSEITYVVILIFFLNHLVSFNLDLEIIVLFIIFFLIIFYLFKSSEKFGKLRSINEVKFFKTLIDTLSIYKELKLNNQSKGFIVRYKNFLNNYYKSKIYSGLINISPKFILEFFSIIFFFILYKNSNLNINQFFLKYSVLALAMLRLIPSFAKISSYVTTIIYNFHSIKFIQNDLKKNIKLKFQKLEHNLIKNINLKNISLEYYSNNNLSSFKVLDNLSLSFNKSKIYGIYGPSGSGKTSLLNIIIGFIKPQKGALYYNDHKQEFNQIKNNYKISFLQQNPIILDENIIINSTLKFSNITEEIDKIKLYLKKFNLSRFLSYKFINNNSIQSIKNMSGGEKQRICFIRSIINDPNLLILDEPASALDSKNAEIIFKFLRSFKKDRIIIVTSHKDSEKKYFDKLIYL